MLTNLQANNTIYLIIGIVTAEAIHDSFKFSK